MHAPQSGSVLPETFGVFPLTGALLLPDGRLPLNIFEPRYLALVEDALGESRMFGMIQPDARQPAGPTGPALCRVGCLGRLTSFAETEDGRFLITLTGLVRFAVAEEVDMRRGYRRVRGETSAFEADLHSDPSGVLRDFNRAALVGALRRYFVARQFEANWSAIDEMSDVGLVTTLSMACPFPPAEKQALLEAPTPRARADALKALLEFGAREVDGDEPTVPS